MKKRRLSLAVDLERNQRLEEGHWESKYHDLVDDYANYRVKFSLQNNNKKEGNYQTDDIIETLKVRIKILEREKSMKEVEVNVMTK